MYERIPPVIARSSEKGSKIAMVARGRNKSDKKNAILGRTRSLYRAVESDLVMELEYAHDLF